MPTITHLTLWYAAGVLTVIGSKLEPLTTAVALGIGVVALLTENRQERAVTIALPYGLMFGCLGAALTVNALDQRSNDCRLRLRDGHQNDVVVTVLELPAGPSARLQLSRVNGHACNAPIRVLPPRSGYSFKGGESVRITGEWWRDHAADVLREPNGVLLASHVSRADESALLPQLRGRAAASIRDLFAAQAPLAEALLIAQRDGIDPRVKQDFAASGLSHLLAISGTHVALVAAVAVLLAALFRVSTVTGLTVGAGAAVFYVIFLGAPYPAVRAAAQIVFVVTARMLQRPAHAFALLASAALLILLYDPLALIDAGFQLSFAGLIGILVWRKPLIERLPESVPLILRDAVATAIAAAVATTPITAFHFSQVSAIAVPANLLALPVVSIAVPAAALALAVDPVSHQGALFIAGAARLALARLEQIAALAGNAPGGHFFVTRAGVLAALIAAAIAWLWWQHTVRRRRLVALALAAVLWFPLSRFLATAGRDSIEIHAIDVGQGDAIALRSPHGRWLLVDAGPASDRYDAGAARVLPFLLKHGARSLDLLVITHPHLDHFGGVAAVARTIAPEIVLDPDSSATTVGELSAVAAVVRHQWMRARPGLRLMIDGISIEVLHPDRSFLDGSDDPNDYSVVLHVGYGRFAAVLTGDAPASVEEALIARYAAQLDVDVLKVGHHGSSTSSSATWLAHTTPVYALVSVGRGNRYGHPSPEVMARLDAVGARTLRTDREGSISLRAFPDGRVERMGAR